MYKVMAGAIWLHCDLVETINVSTLEEVAAFFDIPVATAEAATCAPVLIGWAGGGDIYPAPLPNWEYLEANRWGDPVYTNAPEVPRDLLDYGEYFEPFYIKVEVEE